ncbi:MAG: hypothetical protein AAFQ14_13910 [Cyanobacteria bacterium J06621_12]
MIISAVCVMVANAGVEHAPAGGAFPPAKISVATVERFLSIPN